jgi:prevent-host-death family protein
MKVVEKADANGSLAAYTENVANDPVIITEHGKPVAALIPIENADLETVSLSTNRKFIELIERSRARTRTEGGIPSEEMRRRLG